MKALVYISQVNLEKVAVLKLAGCKLQREVLASIMCCVRPTQSYLL